jgi:hypothetical protein
MTFSLRCDKRWSYLAAGVALLLLPAGCGGDQPRVYQAGGKVTLPDGTPLAGARVEFQPTDNLHLISASGEVQPDGTFELTTFSAGDGAVAGEYRVAVMPPRPAGDPDEWVGRPPSPIDRRYSSFENSGLRFEVSTLAAENQFQIVVQPPAGS